MKTVLITGASSGIGKAAALLFAKEGWQVLAVMRRPEKATELCTIPHIEVFKLDVNSQQSIDEVLVQIGEKYRQIHVLVNNAGIYTTSPLEDTANESIDSIIQTNVNGVVYMTKSLIGHFRKHGMGTIVNVSSIIGRTALPFQSIYQASKWAVEGFSEGIRYELKPLNIRVKLVEPGMVKTPLYDEVLSIDFEKYTSVYRNDFRKWHRFLMNLYRKGNPAEAYAKAIFRAANSRSGKFRYRVDLLTKLAIAAHSLLPLSWFQIAVRWVYRR